MDQASDASACWSRGADRSRWRSRCSTWRGSGLAPLFALRLLHGIAYGACSTTIGTIVTALVPDSRKGEGVGYYMLSVTLGRGHRPLPGHVPVAERRLSAPCSSTTAVVAGLSLAVAAAQLKVPEAGDRKATRTSRSAADARSRAHERDERAGDFRVPRFASGELPRSPAYCPSAPCARCCSSATPACWRSSRPSPPRAGPRRSPRASSS